MTDLTIIVDARMRPLTVIEDLNVVVGVLINDLDHFARRVKAIDITQLILEATEKRFDIAILPR